MKYVYIEVTKLNGQWRLEGIMTEAKEEVVRHCCVFSIS